MARNTKSLAKAMFSLALLITCNIPGGMAQTYTFQTWSSGNPSALTVTAFRSVTIDKRGIVWAGSDLGGLYNYKNNTWAKVNTYPDVTFRHLVPSNMPGDSNVWATSIGKNAVQATTGGAYLINTQAESVTQYGSGIAGGLSSRYANSLALSRTGKTYVALAQSLTGSTTNQGGVFVTNTVNPPPPSSTSFTKAIPDVAGTGDIIYHSAGNRGGELWFGRGSNCDGTGSCAAPYIARLTSSGASLSSVTNANSPLPFTNTSTSPFARAIFTDTITGNTFVGLSSGGIGVLKLNGSWKLLTNTNSPFPAGAAVNFNAISEVYGEIWVGTTAGIFVYNGTGSLDNMGSFKVLTTANGLPSNNITDMAVDTARSQIWVTSSAGVSRAPYIASNIKGTVFDVFCNRPESSPDSLKLFDELQKTPLTTGVKIELYENGILKESATTNAEGVFELTSAEDGKLYTVVIKYKKGDNEIVYKYPSVKNHDRMGGILIPATLIDEIKAFKPQMEKRCFTMKLQFSISLKIVCLEGFEVSQYDQAYEKFYDINGIQDNYKKRVENLADFYASVATVYNLGGSSNELIDAAVINAFDAIEALLDNVSFGAAAKEKEGLDLDLDDKTWNKLTESTLKLVQSSYLESLKDKAASYVTDPEAKKLIEKFYTLLSDAGEFGITLIKEGRSKALIEAGKDAFKKAAATVIAAWYYKYYYCRTQHKSFLLNAATSSKNASSDFLYNETYNKLYSPSANSLVKLSNDTLELFKDKVKFYQNIAKVAEYAKTVAEAVSAISAFIPGGQGVSVVFKTVATAAKFAKPAALTIAMIQAVNGGLKIAVLSDKILPQTGFTNTLRMNRTRSPASQQTPATLLARKNSYNQKLVQLKTIYDATVFDSVAYVTRYNEMVTEDSLYTDEMTKTLHALWASADSGVLLVPGFKNKLAKVIDTFVTPQYHNRNSFLYANMSYRFNPDKTADVPQLDSLVNEITILNDSAVNGITYLAGDINANGIPAPAYLVQEGYNLNHTRVPGSAGSFTYTFKNYGTQPQNNVSFKLIKDIAAGYLFTSPDSVNVGTILPGEAKQVNFTFTSPVADSVCVYTINVKAANGSYRDVSGSLYVIDPSKVYTEKVGNWSDPNTWSSKAVPTSTTHVMINHQVTVDVDASCKAITATIPGKITVSAGKRLTVLQ